MPAASGRTRKSDRVPYREVQKNMTNGNAGRAKTDYKYIIVYKSLIAEYDLKLLAIAYDPHNTTRSWPIGRVRG